jgi:hypothetical protein
VLRQAAHQDGDEDDVVHAQDDLQGGEHRKGDPEVRIEQKFHGGRAGGWRGQMKPER